MKVVFLVILAVMLFPASALCAGNVLTFDCTPAADAVTGAKLQFNADPPFDVPLVSTCGTDPATRVTCVAPSVTICYPDTTWPVGAFVAKALVYNTRDSSAYSLPLNVPGIPSSPGLLKVIKQQ